MRLRTILENVRLSYLLERKGGGWDANLNWEDTLSLGEQQRLGMVSKCSMFNFCFLLEKDCFCYLKDFLVFLSDIILHVLSGSLIFSQT